jgi:hypothetical protein
MTEEQPICFICQGEVALIAMRHKQLARTTRLLRRGINETMAEEETIALAEHYLAESKHYYSGVVVVEKLLNLVKKMR